MFSLKKLKGYADISSLKDARWAIQHEYAKEKGYPLWSLKYCSSQYNNEQMTRLVDDVIQVVSDPESMKKPNLLISTISGYEEQKYEWGNMLQENNGGNYKEGFNNFIKSVDIVNLQDNEIDDAMKYLHGHLEGEVGLWKEVEVKEKLKDWRISQNVTPVVKPIQPVVQHYSPYINNGEHDQVANSTEVNQKKREKLIEKLKFMPTSELQKVVSEIIEKEDGYILDILWKYVQ